MLTVLLEAFVLFALGTGGHPVPALERPGQTGIWALIDTVWVHPEGECCYSIRAFRIAVAAYGTWDTLDIPVLEPTVLGDTALAIPIVRPEQSVHVYVYHRASRVLQPVGMPTDYDPNLAWPVFSPRTSFLAYEARAEGGTRVVVRTWPGLRLAVSSPVIPGCTDVPLRIEWPPGENYVRWYPPPCEPHSPRVDSVAVDGS